MCGIRFRTEPVIGHRLAALAFLSLVGAAQPASAQEAPTELPLIDHFPAGMGKQARCEPVYETLEGWSESTRGARSWAALPATAIKYVRRIEELVETPVQLLSTSPEREDTILMRDPFAD